MKITMNILNNKKRPFPFLPKGSEGNGKYDYTIVENAEPIAVGRAARRLTEKLARKNGNLQKAKKKRL